MDCKIKKLENKRNIQQVLSEKGERKMKKRFIKQTAVLALFTATILSTTTVAFGASSSVDQSVNKLKTELSKATTHYVYPALDGDLASSNELYSALNSAKKNYQLTRKAVVSSSKSAASKKVTLAEIDALYNEKVSGGLVPYIDAYNYAIKYLEPIMNDIQAAKANNDFATVEKKYHELSYQLKGRTAILYRFSGKAARDLLLKEYKEPANEIRDELMVPVTIHMKNVEITDLLANDKKEQAKLVLAEVEALLPRLPDASKNSFVAALLEEVTSMKEQVNDTTLSPQHVLDSKVKSLVAILNTTQSDKATAVMTASNSITVTINKDVDPLDYTSYLGKGFYSSFINILGVTAIDGNHPLSTQGVNTLLASVPVGSQTLADLKGHTLSLPITVNNGTALTVEFKIIFK